MPEHDVDSLQPEIAFRPLNAEDLPFLHDSWGSSVYRGTTAHFHLTPGEFHSFHRAARERFFQKPPTTVIVACPTADPWLIAGWIAVEDEMPDDDITVLVVVSDDDGDGAILLGFHDGDHWRNAEHNDEIARVTHWMDLPALPEA